MVDYNLRVIGGAGIGCDERRLLVKKTGINRRGGLYREGRLKDGNVGPRSSTVHSPEYLAVFG